jgi:hypothetical protein
VDGGVGDGNRTRNNRSHSPVLCQLSYSHRILLIIAQASAPDRGRQTADLGLQTSDFWQESADNAGTAYVRLGIPEIEANIRGCV